MQGNNLEHFFPMGNPKGGYRMNEFDRKLKSQIKKEDITCPKKISDTIDRVLDSLPEARCNNLNSKNKRSKWPGFAAIAFAALFLFFFILANTSSNFVQAMEDVPILGTIVKVTTIRNYLYDDGNYNIDIKMPYIDMDGKDPAKFINASLEELTNTLINQFNEDMSSFGEKGHAGLNIDYNVVTNSDSWFTLRIRVTETAASSNSYYEFYHIDIKNGQIAQLSDLFISNGDYIEAISDNIHSQMIKQMEDDSSLIYWIDIEKPEMAFHKIDENQSFYFSDTGKLVIVFDEYEIAPGYMGTPEFEIARSVYSEYLKK